MATEQILLNKLLNSFSVDSSAMVITDYTDDAVLKGISYSIETVFTLVTAKTLDLIFDPRALVASNKIFMVHPTKWSVNQEYLEATLGVCTGYDTGTPLTLQNDNYLYADSNPAKTLVSYGVDRTIAGYIPSSTVIPMGTEATRQNAGGGLAESGGIQILDPSLIYVFRIPNATGATIKVGFYVNVFEI